MYVNPGRVGQGTFIKKRRKCGVFLSGLQCPARLCPIAFALVIAAALALGKRFFAAAFAVEFFAVRLAVAFARRAPEFFPGLVFGLLVIFGSSPAMRCSSIFRSR